MASPAPLSILPWLPLPDLGGYGDTHAPASPSEYTAFHIVGDLVGLLDSQRIEQVYLVGHDWGAIIAWHFCLFRPDRIKALVNTSAAFVPRSPLVKPVDELWELFCDEYYIRMFQDPEEAEEQYSKLYSEPAATVLERFFTLRDPNPSGMSNDIIHTEPGVPPSLPSWLSEEDISYYSSKFEKTGFAGGLTYYQAMNKTWELTAPWTESKINVPVKFIVGDLDVTYHVPGTKEHINNGGMKKRVPRLEEVVVMALLQPTHI